MAYRTTHDRSGRDARDVSREQYPRDPVDSKDQRRVDERDSDRMENRRDWYSELRSSRQSSARSVNSYSYADERDRGEADLSPRKYMDYPRDRYTTPADSQSVGRGRESQYQEYFLPGEGINREVIQYDICRYLGQDATVRPYTHVDGRNGYLIKAYRAMTTVSTAHIVKR